MPAFFSRRRKSQPAPIENLAVLPHFTVIQNRPYNKPFVEQKIHPDLNSLAEELESSQGHELQDMTIENEDPCVEATDFIGLEPSTRRNRRQNEAHTRARGPQCQQISIPHLASASNLDHAESGTDNIRLPGETSPPSDSPASIAAPSPKKGWSIFGRKPPRIPHRNSDASNATSNVSRSRSQSSSSQPRSRTTSQDRNEASQSRTPKSQSSYNSTHHTGSNPSCNLGDGLLPSPHTFGLPTPPKEPMTGPADDHSYFGFRETPPPLPPLDHPAFRQASKGHISSTGNLFSIHGNHQEKVPRHSHSLPSLAHSGGSDTQCDIKEDNRKRHRRASSRPRFEISTLRREELPSIDKTTKVQQHNKNDSVSSSIGTRRSSAEYSAKNASSVGYEEGKRNECWEVQVSKEMVRLALGEVVHKVDAINISPFGSKNVGLL